MTQRRQLWLVVDLVALVVFATIGRRSHAEGITVAGVLSTAWPFAVGVVVGWLVVRAWRRPVAVWPSGVGAWLGALGVGMLLRRVAGEGTPLDFVAVAAVFLAVFLLGWRLVLGLVQRGRSSAARSGPS
ncbi:MAG TPA: DUF3054 domain-containing protein [Angustibacter sp.]|nr:DUF3054 domain-containing protein [Angustibacter sp.]